MPDIPPFPTDRDELSRALEQLGAPRLPGLLGIELLEITEGASSMRMRIGERHLASNGYLHAASVVALADTTAGYGCVANLPGSAIGFTTIELKSNHLGTQLDGALLSEGTLAHGGRTTQVWDVVVTAEDTAKKIALFRCTQMILYPPADLISPPMSDSYDLIVKLRAIREFKPDPLSDEDLGAILEAARWTGSSKNRQDWSFIVVTGDRLRGLAEHGDYTDPIRASAATIVLVKEDGGNLFDIGRAAQNIMLAAKTIGVASCPITLHRPADARLFLGAPDGVETRYAVALGYPTPGTAPSRFGGRKPAEAVVRYERY